MEQAEWLLQGAKEQSCPRQVAFQRGCREHIVRGRVGHDPIPIRVRNLRIERPDPIGHECEGDLSSIECGYHRATCVIEDRENL